MSHQSVPAPLKWRSAAVLMELTRTFKDYCIGELLYAVPALLKRLEDASPGLAADEICLMLDKVYLKELEENRFPSFVKCCQKFVQNKQMPKKKDSALKLIKELLETRNNLRSEGLNFNPPAMNLRSSIVSSRSRSNSRKILSHKTRKNSRPGNIRKQKRKMFGKNGSRSGSVKRPSSITSYESVASVDDGRRRGSSKSDFVEMIKSESIMSMLHQYEISDIQIVLIFVLSSYHNKRGLLPKEKTDTWLELAASPLFKSRSMMLNHLHNDLNSDQQISKYRLLVIDEVISFIWRNSMAKPYCGKVMGPLLLGCMHSGEKYEVSGRLFNRILFTCDILLPTKAVARHRIWDVDNKEKIASEEVTDTKYYHKKQLINFYQKRNENRYALIVDQLFKMYRFKDIVMGVYNKYHYSIEEWTNKVRDKVNAADLADLELTTKNNRHVKGWRARNHNSSFLNSAPDEVESKMESTIRGIETRIIDSEVDFNERLRMLQEKFVKNLDKSQAQKYRSIVFNSDFKALLEASNKIAVRLEVLNLVRKPVLNSVFDLSSRTLMDQNSSDPAMLLRSRTAVTLTRYNLLCDIYLDHLESLYHGYVPYILHFQRCKQYVQEREPVQSGRSVVGSIRGSARNAIQKTFVKAGKLSKRTQANLDPATRVSPLRTRNKTQPPRAPGRLSARSTNHRSVSLHTGATPTRRAAGKLTDEDRFTNKHLLTTKRDTRKQQSTKRTGSVLSMMHRQKKDLIYYFAEIKENEECFKDQTLMKMLSEPERRFEEIRLSFAELYRNLHKTDPVARKAKKVVKLVKELEACLARDKSNNAYLERTMGENEVEKCRRVMIQRVKIEVDE